MEPNNPQYRFLLNQIQRGGYMYQQQSRNFGIPTSVINSLCLSLCLARLCCLFCEQPYYF
jgi:molecular chaperone DnaJ